MYPLDEKLYRWITSFRWFLNGCSLWYLVNQLPWFFLWILVEPSGKIIELKGRCIFQLKPCLITRGRTGTGMFFGDIMVSYFFFFGMHGNVENWNILGCDKDYSNNQRRYSVVKWDEQILVLWIFSIFLGVTIWRFRNQWYFSPALIW